MPTLSPEPHERYKTVLPDRWDRFPPTKAQIVNYQLKDKRTWRHELRHDAESVLWLLVWWAVHAWPVTVRDWDDSRYIPHGPYKSLVGDAMARGTYMCVFPKDALHQHYCGLLPLLVKLTSQLSGDYHWAVDGIFTHPDFVHEAFQRHIFEFLVNNKGASFMDLQRRNSPRPVAKRLNCYRIRITDPTAGSMGFGLSTLTKLACRLSTLVTLDVWIRFLFYCNGCMDGSNRMSK